MTLPTTMQYSTRAKGASGETATFGVEFSDEQLMEAAKGGDREAFSRLIDRYRTSARAYAMAILGNREEAEDAAQEAFVKAYLSLDKFRAGEAWQPYFMRILKNGCTDVLRKRKTRKTESWGEREQVADSPGPEEEFIHEESERELRQAVAALPEKFRDPLLLHYVSRQTYKEIAMTLDLPESTVVGRLAGAMRNLRRRFGNGK